MLCRPSDNVLLLGLPGAGKSMLAPRLTTILPAMTLAEAIETTRIHRVAGRTDGRTALVSSRRFRGGLCYSIAMSMGHSSDGEAVRGWCSINTISRTS
jgi:Magnesium chelatase, subunit ChlI